MVRIMDSFSQRMPDFVTVPLKSVNNKALDDIRSIRGLSKDDVIPLECVINNIEMIKVHVDWLNEETHSIFRRKCLDETGFPGEFLSKDEHCFPKIECRHNHDPSIWAR